ncbi:hypothetical protein AVEN_176691-1 [Araneus ventricosus]|uniref:Uncharacterized protein n=1 Tax=Araneus ventricosus TaxID=182803 RepID=A0A4Y2NL61_ARAVE|nr:hypothetical protein AVEN_176691-1 [Araneus ventricosus]
MNGYTWMDRATRRETRLTSHLSLLPLGCPDPLPCVLWKQSKGALLDECSCTYTGLKSSARPSPRVRSPAENERFIVKEESAASVDTRGKTSNFVHCLYALAGYNEMAFTPWVKAIPL